MYKLSFNALLLFLLIPILVSGSAFSQSEKDSTASKKKDDPDKVSLMVYPFAFYSPETELAFGLGGVIGFNMSSRKQNPKLSSITGSGYYTTNGQYSFTFTPELYIGKNETRVWGKLAYDKAIDKYYGTGNNVSEFDSADYLQNNFTISALVQTRVFDDRLKVGVSFERRDLKMKDKQKNPFLTENLVTGSDGGATQGIGITASWDSRDNVNFPSKGGFYEFFSTYFFKSLGSDFEYTKYSFDLRRFMNPVKDHVIATQAYMLVEAKTPPFYDLGLLGGDTKMRGYYTGRYRDRVYYTLQAEYRIPKIFWKLGVIAFAGMGDVAPAIDKITISTVKPTYGLGLRFRFDELSKLDLRMDIGIGKGTTGVYFGAKQTF